ncbi:MAG: M24 family metallopeptidase [Deltaproteobacteria bacterium]|nr:M24 family metallopeptidase [Deltaproteobacteria bacterium]
MSNAKLIYDCPEKNADLYYAAHFEAPDAVLFLEHHGKKILILSDLELERGKKEAKVDKILSLSHLVEKAKKRGAKGMIGVIDTLFKDFKIKKLTVPQSSPFTLVDALRKKGYKVEAGEHPFYPARTLKTPQEKKWITDSQKAVFKAMALAEKILGESKIKNNILYWHGTILTSERLRFELEQFLLQMGFHNTMQPIVAGGLQATDPHCIGSGSLRAHQTIIVDIFPRNDKTRFFGDATRTFCKGKASAELKKMYQTVKEAQEMAIAKIKAGVNGKTIHQAIVDYFEKKNFPTQVIGGVKQGFIHGTGHGIGLDLHEEPVRINTGDFVLKPGHVVTVEPGLYYHKIGGVRIEDIVYVTKTGCEVLASYPKKLEIA